MVVACRDLPGDPDAIGRQPDYVSDLMRRRASPDLEAVYSVAEALKVDVALMPCGGTYTMTAAEMAAAANGFKPKVLIPMHWGDIVGSQADAEAVKKAFAGTTVIKSPTKGSGYSSSTP